MPAPRQFDLELLEPRVLLSATPLPVPAPNGPQDAIANPAIIAPPNTSASSQTASPANSTVINPFEGVSNTDLPQDDKTAPANQTQPSTPLPKADESKSPADSSVPAINSSANDLPSNEDQVASASV